MCSHCRIPERSARHVAALLAAFALGACHEASQTAPPTAPQRTQATPVSTLFPGNGQAPPVSAEAAKFADDAQARTEGERLFDWYNCAGCHFHGAGGIGPSLMDNDWIYGGSVDDIYASIEQGRPNGMPSWGGKLSPTEIWQIAAYVHSLPARNPSGAASLPTEPLPALRDGDAVAPYKDVPDPSQLPGTTK